MGVLTSIFHEHVHKYGYQGDQEECVDGASISSVRPAVDIYILSCENHTKKRIGKNGKESTKLTLPDRSVPPFPVSSTRR